MAKKVGLVDTGAKLELMFVNLTSRDANAIACHDHVEPQLIKIRWGRISTARMTKHLCQRREPHRHSKRKIYMTSKSITTAEKTRQPFRTLCGLFVRLLSGHGVGVMVRTKSFRRASRCWLMSENLPNARPDIKSEMSVLTPLIMS